jgi:hypothetical protein
LLVGWRRVSAALQVFLSVPRFAGFVRARCNRLSDGLGAVASMLRARRWRASMGWHGQYCNWHPLAADAQFSRRPTRCVQMRR